MSQTQLVLDTEGDAWLARNRDRLGRFDRVSEMIAAIGLKPGRVIEVGCANGWRLAALQKQYNCAALGIEPSREACHEGRRNGLHIKRSTADKLPVLSGWCDLLIYGFCLYLADPEDWLRIAAEGDRVLANNGHMIIHDFAVPHSGVHAVPYHHNCKLKSYHYDFSRLWLGNPLYRLITSASRNQSVVTVLIKNPSDSIEVRK